MRKTGVKNVRWSKNTRIWAGMMLQMSETRVKGERIEGEIIYRDTYYIKPISYHGSASRLDQYGCLLCEKYEIGNLIL